MSIGSVVIPTLARYGVIALLSAIAAWSAQGWRYGERIARIEQRSALADADRAVAVADAERRMRLMEAASLRKMEEKDRETTEKLVEIAAAEHLAADERVHKIATEYATRYRVAAGRATAAAERKAADAAIRMFADMLGELDGLAQIYAAEADRRRVAGLACEAVYDDLRPDQSQNQQHNVLQMMH
ncbi:MAG: DUF2514 family protein [Corticimicrobacter sp.]|uniref:DUF2514 family protein n=1 Tax=Corticimicrobacter sp. TaxID=2678536 RepID=UPI0032DAFBAD